MGKKYAGGDRLKTPETMLLLKGRIDLRPVRNTSLIEIRVYSEKAAEAANIANAVAEAYKKHRLDQKELEPGRNQGAGGTICGAGRKSSDGAGKGG